MPVTRIRVSSQLTDASTGTLLWSDTTQAPVGDLFQVQDELVQRIVASLSLPLTAREHRMIQHDVPASNASVRGFSSRQPAQLDSKQMESSRAICTSDASRRIRAMRRRGRAWAEFIM